MKPLRLLPALNPIALRAVPVEAKLLPLPALVCFGLDTYARWFTDSIIDHTPSMVRVLIDVLRCSL